MNEINDLLSKKAEMSLLFAQSLEIQTLYHQPIPNNTFPISNYYLLPKKWLDEYKNSYNYNLIKPKYEEYSDYNNLWAYCYWIESVLILIMMNFLHYKTIAINLINIKLIFQ